MALRTGNINIFHIIILAFILINCEKKNDSDDSRNSSPNKEETVVDPNTENEEEGSEAENNEKEEEDSEPDDDSLDMNSTAGQLILNNDLGGVNGAELPTVIYDITNDTSRTIIDPNDPAVIGTLSIGSSLTDGGFGLTGSPVTISSSLGGYAEFTGDISASNRKGNVKLDNFISRTGFPKVKAGSLDLDLETTGSDITGKIAGTDIVLNGNTVSLSATYALYEQSGYWRGIMKGLLSTEDGEVNFEYNYDTPILSSVTVVPLDGGDNETTGDLVDGGKARLKISVNSNAPVNWFNLMWDSPTTNLSGGGSGTSYCLMGACGAPQQNRFEEIEKGYWTYYQDFEISEYQPSGIYKWDVSVSNASELGSRNRVATQKVVNSSASGPPTIYSASVLTDAGLTSGSGGDAVLRIVVESVAPANWINSSLNGPSTNVFGGGSGVTFDDCSTHTATGGHPCFGLAGNYRYYAQSVSFTAYSENGTYTFADVSVGNEANLTSENANQSLTFTISGNVVATTPVITSVTMYRDFSSSSDPSADGTIVANDECFVNSVVADPFKIAIVIDSTSNAPVDWLNSSVDGPTINITGGGSGRTPIDLTGGNWETNDVLSLDAPSFKPEGDYSFNNLSVANEGSKTSTNWAGDVHFQLKAACP